MPSLRRMMEHSCLSTDLHDLALGLSCLFGSIVRGNLPAMFAHMQMNFFFTK